MRRAIFLVCLGLAAPSIGCSGSGSYVWYSQLSPEALAAANEYVVTIGDMLNIRVLGHEDMSTHVRVRSDGRVAVPIVGEVAAAGKRPSALRSEIEARLKDYIVMPSVTLNVDETLPPKVMLLGEVGHPGVFAVEPNTSLAEALALGGGITEYASRDRIFLLRSTPQPVRIRFTWDAVTHDIAHAATFPVRAGDVIVVE
jgi:polysaccharide export outer membrane protein